MRNHPGNGAIIASPGGGRADVSRKRTHHRGATTMRTFGPASLVLVYAAFALLLWVAFDSPGVLAATMILGVLIFLVSAFTGRPIR